ncbi:hypothetical protein [Vandammella animalimorsus]|nr:hypothetical protein [Vandammella animalimorsus]
MDQLLHAHGWVEGDAAERRLGSVLQAFQRGFTQARSRIGSALL